MCFIKKIFGFSKQPHIDLDDETEWVSANETHIKLVQDEESIFRTSYQCVKELSNKFFKETAYIFKTSFQFIKENKISCIINLVELILLFSFCNIFLAIVLYALIFVTINVLLGEIRFSRNLPKTNDEKDMDFPKLKIFEEKIDI